MSSSSELVSESLMTIGSLMVSVVVGREKDDTTGGAE